jgi:hypothetical protein
MESEWDMQPPVARMQVAATAIMVVLIAALLVGEAITASLQRDTCPIGAWIGRREDLFGKSNPLTFANLFNVL